MRMTWYISRLGIALEKNDISGSSRCVEDVDWDADIGKGWHISRLRMALEEITEALTLTTGVLEHKRTALKAEKKRRAVEN